MKYFNNCVTIDEVKTLYKKLAKENHPDLGGEVAIMQEINTEYAFACAKVLKGENLSTDEVSEQIRLSEEYRQVIEQIINLPNIIIELVGNWIWVTGNTRMVKTELKSAGLNWARQKKCWYFRSEEFATRGGKKSLDEIRGKYGSTTINGTGNRTLNR
jgi:hypothetical protein